MISAARLGPEAGMLLKAARVRVRLSTREVERLSLRLADEKKNREYHISHTWLTDVEKGDFTPSIYKLYALSVIYKCTFDEVLGYFGIHMGNIGTDQTRLALPRTHLIGEQTRDPVSKLPMPSELNYGVTLQKTNLVSRIFHQWGGMPATLLPRKGSHSFVYGYIGLEDFTLYPLIRPGSFVEIDPQQKRIDRIPWSNEYDRPIFFVELRDGYACSWCELAEGRLVLLPSPRSRSRLREVRFPNDADVIGRVTAVSMRIAEEEGGLVQSGDPGRQKDRGSPPTPR
ncbi:hypothetical protein GCM10011507_34470 [Edaphobacter acidisoli]|uniref:HTH cro/C1-type domain-containing protein n=1 Tax=Edaphobacter acidisoli TaxID=2040573 RepID=A0A916S475_9BACT|nr:hypothetical protein [Edaphobacter acidisoli]GGA80329.1 hypothetical protein GCM10011507_34470 [Edaphobacter acidisoli]